MSFEPIGLIAARVVEGVQRRHKTVEELKKWTTTPKEKSAAVQLPTPSGREEDRRQVTEWE